MRRPRIDRTEAASRIALGRAALGRTVFGRVAFGRGWVDGIPFERLGSRRAASARAVRGRTAVALSLLLLVVLLGGCTTVGDILTLDEVKPWERDVLAREDMQPVADAMDEAVDEHLYYSREGSSGGGALRGGGCGCN